MRGRTFSIRQLWSLSEQKSDRSLRLRQYRFLKLGYETCLELAVISGDGSEDLGREEIGVDDYLHEPT